MDKNVHKIILFQPKLTLLIQYLLHRYIKDPLVNTAARRVTVKVYCLLPR